MWKIKIPHTFFIGGKEMKKTITCVLTIIILSLQIISAYATDIETVEGGEVTQNYSYTLSCSSSLSISSRNATCKSRIVGMTSVTKISITQKLQKKSNGSWTNVKTWSKTYNSTSALYTNSKTSLSKGTYRTRTVAKVYSGSNYETVTGNSSSVTI